MKNREVYNEDPSTNTLLTRVSPRSTPRKPIPREKPAGWKHCDSS